MLVRRARAGLREPHANGELQIVLREKGIVTFCRSLLAILLREYPLLLNVEVVTTVFVPAFVQFEDVVVMPVVTPAALRAETRVRPVGEIHKQCRAVLARRRDFQQVPEEPSAKPKDQVTQPRIFRLALLEVLA